MKHIIKYICVFASTLFFVACSEQDVAPAGQRICEVTAIFPEDMNKIRMSSDGTFSEPNAGGPHKVRLEQSDNSGDLIAKWQDDDKISVVMADGNDVRNPISVPVRNLSADHKSCTFRYELPEDWINLDNGYELSCFTSNCAPKVVNGHVYYNASMARMPLNQFRDRVMFEAHVSNSNCYGVFKHYGTYELMHITNNSDNEIQFAMSDFNVNKTWYVRGGFAMRLFDKQLVEDSSYEWQSLSPTVKIPAHGTETIVSWYIPNGNTIDNAQMVANIDGKYVYSTNKISTNVTICTGIAYHMYSSWDGKELKFENGNQGHGSAELSCPDDNHPHVIDMGEAGKWACCNVGASAPWEYGGYYSWGEIVEKDTYDWSNYKHCDGSEDTCHDIGCDIMGTKYDVASVKWRDNWCMPSSEMIQALCDNCTSEWTTINNVEGRKFISSNGNSIFLPATLTGERGEYWSSMVLSDAPHMYVSYTLALRSDYANLSICDRYRGLSVRPIKDPAVDGGLCPDSKHPHIIDMGDAGQWACCNVGATAPWKYGGHFAWGETEEKDDYYDNNYNFYDCNSETWRDIGSNIAGTKYDVAYVKWGSNWCMPSKDKFELLLNGCTDEWTIINCVGGRRFTAYNGKSIFLPAAGMFWDQYGGGFGTSCRYWSSSQDEEEPRYAYFFKCDCDESDWYLYNRNYGLTVRPIYSTSYSGGSDSGDGSGSGGRDRN